MCFKAKRPFDRQGISNRKETFMEFGKCKFFALAVITIFFSPGITNFVQASCERLFPPDVLRREWVSFSAQGFNKPVCGVVYRVTIHSFSGISLGYGVFL